MLENVRQHLGAMDVAGQRLEHPGAAHHAVVAHQEVVAARLLLALVGGDRAGDRFAGAAIAAQGFDTPGAEHDAAQRVVAGVRHVQHVARQCQAMRTPEGGVFKFTIDEIGRAHAELAQNATGVVAFQDAVMATVRDIQAFGGGRDAYREAQ